MQFDRVKLIYFSPTGTTRKVLEGIAEGLASENIEYINLTPSDWDRRPIPPVANELVIIGAPVYGGRLPVEAVYRFRTLAASKAPAVLIVVYGNRDFDDALLELEHLARELGFNPIAGGAFIGEHSFATAERPVANGRPDALDMQKAVAFGQKIKAKLAAMPSPDAPVELEIPGRFPFEGGAREMAVSPVSPEGSCTVCGSCAEVCPTAAISVNGQTTTDIGLCIRCSACIRACPSGARRWEDEMMSKIAHWLHEHCSARKEPQVFGVDG